MTDKNEDWLSALVPEAELVSRREAEERRRVAEAQERVQARVQANNISLAKARSRIGEAIERTLAALASAGNPGIMNAQIGQSSYCCWPINTEATRGYGYGVLLRDDGYVILPVSSKHYGEAVVFSPAAIAEWLTRTEWHTMRGRDSEYVRMLWAEEDDFNTWVNGQVQRFAVDLVALLTRYGLTP